MYSKYTGIEKALHQIKQAVKKGSSDFNLNRLRELHEELMAEAASRSTRPEAARSRHSNTTRPSTAGKEEESEFEEVQPLPNAENPLDLLARAGEYRRRASTDANAIANIPSTRKIDSASTDPLDVHRFFLPINAKPDVGPGLDPVELGLVSIHEAHDLIAL